MGDLKISLLLTNDWELYGEGSGDFYEIQRDRLAAMLRLLESHDAKLTVFAEVGQQWAHLGAASKSAQISAIAKDWESCVEDTIRRGHDVQLHYHPTWKNSELNGTNFRLDLSNWALTDLGPETALATLRRGRDYLNSIGQRARPNYRCIAFRAGAFCLQPIAETIPLLKASGLIADSSVVPGAWDYLYFDYGHVPPQLGPYWLAPDGSIVRAKVSGAAPDRDSVLELPVHTERVWDSPIVRRLLPASLGIKWHYNVSSDSIYNAWARERDKKLLELAVDVDPLESRRRKSKLSARNWLRFLLRKSAYVLDYDFMQPALFVALIKAAIARAEKAGINDELRLVALGHANNAHNTENLERILLALKAEFGAKLEFSTLQQTVDQYAPKSIFSPSLVNAAAESLSTKISTFVGGPKSIMEKCCIESSR